MQVFWTIVNACVCCYPDRKLQFEPCHCLLRADRTNQGVNFPSIARGGNSASFRYKVNILNVWRAIITLTPKMVTSSMTSSQDAFYLKIYLLLGFLTNGKTDHANNWRESQAKKVRFEIFYSCWSFMNYLPWKFSFASRNNFRFDFWKSRTVLFWTTLS